MNKIYRFWYCDEMGKWLMHVSYDWAYRRYGFRPNGKGDLLFFMSLYALITGDVKVIKTCIELVNEQKRWPDSLNHPNDAKNVVGQYISIWWYNICKKLFPKKIVFVKYRPQKSMTRDIITMLLCAVYWHQCEMIRDIEIPKRLNRGSFKHWVDYLMTGDDKYKVKYEKRQRRGLRFKIKYPGYVKHLNAWRAWLVKSDVKEDILKHIPKWNMLCRMLCGERVDWEDVILYQGSNGYLWMADTPPNNPVICTEHEPFQMDEEILRFVYENRNW